MLVNRKHGDPQSASTRPHLACGMGQHAVAIQPTMHKPAAALGFVSQQHTNPACGQQLTSSRLTSNVPPPRSNTRTVWSFCASKPYASAAATGSLPKMKDPQELGISGLCLNCSWTPAWLCCISYTGEDGRGAKQVHQLAGSSTSCNHSTGK